MQLRIAPKPTDHLVPTPIVHQTAFWGRVHRRLGFGIAAYDVAFDVGGGGAAPRAQGDVLVVRAPLTDDADYAYVPFGPEVAPAAEAAGVFLERLSRALHAQLGPRCAFIRWDLPWTSVYANDAAPPERLRELRMNIGTEEQNLYKAPRDLLPPDTVVIDLAGSEDALLGRMHAKTRYNIRLAARRGVVVEEGTAADLPAWYEVYRETAARHHLAPLPLAHFATLLDERGEGSASPVVTRLLLARRGGTLLAGMLLALAPARATYLYGASTRAHRDLMGATALQWAAILAAKAHGCADYDLFGAAPRGDAGHGLAGVHRFKVGFGGRLVHREGCWDFPYAAATYAACRQWELARLAQRRLAP